MKLVTPSLLQVLEVEPHVLGHQRARQAALEVVALDDPREAVERREVDAARVVDDVEQLREVEIGLLRGDHHLGRRGEADRVEEVVEQLGDVARSPASPMW